MKMNPAAPPNWLFEIAETIYPSCEQEGTEITPQNAAAAFTIYFQAAECALSTRTSTKTGKEKSLRKQLASAKTKCVSMRKKEGVMLLSIAFQQILSAAKKMEWQPGSYRPVQTKPVATTRTEQNEEKQAAEKFRAVLPEASENEPHPKDLGPKKDGSVSRTKPRGGGIHSSAGKARARAHKERVANMPGWRGSFERLVDFAEKHNKEVLRQIRINPIIGEGFTLPMYWFKFTIYEHEILFLSTA